MRLIINNIEADIFQDIALNKKIVDPLNLSERYIAFSYSISLPKSANNNKIFSSAFDMNVNKPHFATLYEATIIFSSELFECTVLLEEITDNAYSIRVMERTKIMFEQFKAKINEYDFNCYSEVSGGVIINQNFDNENNSLNSLYLMNGIQQTDNLKYSFADYYENAEMSPVKWVNVDWDTGKDSNFKLPVFSIQNMLRHIIEKNGYDYIPADKDIVFTGKLDKINFLIAEDNEVYSDLAYISGSDIVIDADISTFGEFYIDNDTDNDYVINVTVTDSTAGKSVSEDITVPANTYTFKRLKNVKLGIDSYYSVNNSSGLTDNLKIYASANDINWNDDSDLSVHSDYIPKYSFSELMKVFCVMNNIVPVVRYNEFYFENLNFENNFIDISDKIDYQSIAIQPIGLNNENYFVYNNDATVNDELGKGYFESEGLDTAEVFKTSFSGSVDINDVISIPLLNNGIIIENQTLNARIGMIENGNMVSIDLQDICNNTFYEKLYKNKKLTVSAWLTISDFTTINAGTVLYIEKFGRYRCLSISDFIYGERCSLVLIKI